MIADKYLNRLLEANKEYDCYDCRHKPCTVPTWFGIELIMPKKGSCKDKENNEIKVFHYSNKLK